jgi:putative transposase
MEVFMSLMEEERKKAIQRHLEGETPTVICRTLGRTTRWFYKWLTRYRSKTADWYVEKPHRRLHFPDRTPDEIEKAVKMVRLELYNEGLFCGSQAILGELEELGIRSLPSLRTIDRILSRNALTHRRIGRYKSKGRLYPKLVGHALNEVHQTDWVGPLYLLGPIRYYSLNAVDLATGRCGIQPSTSRSGQSVFNAYWRIWRRLGIPQNLQVDNEMGFYGSPTHPRGMGPLIRLCLHQGVEPWFIPMREPWRNGVVEKFNDHYQQKFVARVNMTSEGALAEESLKFENKHNSRYRYSKLHRRTPLQAMEALGERPRFPREDDPPKYPLEKPTHGKYHVVRLIRSDGRLNLFGEMFKVPQKFQHEYVVGTVNVRKQKLELFHDGLKVEEHDYKLR